MSRKKIYYRVEDDCVSPMIMELDEAMEYAKECLEGITVGMPIKITPVEMTEAQFSQLPEFEG